MLQLANPLCHCGSGQAFTACCHPLIEQHVYAETAVTLMRSRYTAYVLKRGDYLLATWAPATKPVSLDLDAERIKWLGLKIHRCIKGLAADNDGEVEFTALFLAENMFCTMHEISSFICLADKWCYVDGKCEMTRNKLDRNTTCPCGSGKKFKRCCRLK